MNSPSGAFDVVGLGVSTADILSLVDEFPQGEGVQQARCITAQSGGPVATAMATVAKLGGQAAMLDVVSDDWCGNLICSSFEQYGVSIDYLKRVPGKESASASVLVRSGDGLRAIAYSPGTVPSLQPDDVSEEIIARASILHVNGRHWQACLHACRLAHRNGTRVSFDGGAHRYAPYIRDLMPLVDICVVAQDFAFQDSGSRHPETAAEKFLACGPELVVITNGLAGSRIFCRDGRSFSIPAFRMPTVVDTTGCGDSYHGAFLFGLTHGWSLEAAATLASAVAALNTRQLGGRAALPTLPEVAAFLAKRPRELSAPVLPYLSGTV